MKGGFLKKVITIVVVFVGLAILIKVAGGSFTDSEKKKVTKNSILHLELNGVILNGQKFLKNIKKYGKEQNIKAVLISINSPGGAVGPSQEIFNEIKRLKEETKKPVICVTSGVMASGAYYSAVACDKIIVAPGALVGSIGVIMEFANIEKLYDWAKISRFSITSGKFKDSGAEYRTMREDEKELFQSMIDEVYGQFKTTVMNERKLDESVVTQYADGRVFTGATAVKMGFADQEGFYQDALKITADAAKLGDKYEVFEVPKKKMSIFDLGESEVEDDLNSMAEFTDVLKGHANKGNIEAAMKYVLRSKYLNQPMFLMPGTWE